MLKHPVQDIQNNGLFWKLVVTGQFIYTYIDLLNSNVNIYNYSDILNENRYTLNLLYSAE